MCRSASPIPQPRRCRRPYHDTDVYDEGGPHNVAASKMTVSGGTMQGSIRAFETFGTTCQHHPRDACNRCGIRGPAGQPDVMGYHTAQEVP